MRVLLLNQAFFPDVVSTAQHLTDLALDLQARGHEVTVITADRGYDDRRRRFPARETWNGITVRRVATPGLGKGSRIRRAAEFASFLAGCAREAVRAGRFDVVVALTSPPLLSALGAAHARLRGGRLVLWMMDLNPDEAVAAGWLRKGSVLERGLERLLRWSLRRADRVVVLDRFMRARVAARGIPASRVSTLAPWAHDDRIRFDPRRREAFRRTHEIDDRFVVMHSGNHSPCHPLRTLLEAARALAGDPAFHFCFVGGGSELPRVAEFAERHGLRNVRTLPYQPLDELSGSLSAADLHAVVMGDPFVGIVHPCKVYNLLAIGAPILYIGPEESPIADLAPMAEERGAFYAIRHGDVNGAVRAIRAARERAANRIPVANPLPVFSRETAVPALVSLLESGAGEETVAARESASTGAGLSFGGPSNSH